ncbi:hypothetical protein ACPF04_10175 [Campylobacter sp. MOP51]
MIKTVGVHFEQMGFCSKNVKYLKKNSKVAITYDPSNGNIVLRIIDKMAL